MYKIIRNKKNINNVYCPEEYLIWGPSDLVNPDFKNKIEEINIKNSKNFDSRLSFFNLLNI